MANSWKRVKTIGYIGAYDYGPNVDRRATGGVVRIEERNNRGKVQRRAVTSNGRFSFITLIK